MAQVANLRWENSGLSGEVDFCERDSQSFSDLPPPLAPSVFELSGEERHDQRQEAES